MIKLYERLHALRLLLLIPCALAFAALVSQFGTRYNLDLGDAPLAPSVSKHFYLPEKAGARTFRHTRPEAQAPLPLLNDLAMLEVELAGNGPQPAPLLLAATAQSPVVVQPQRGFRIYHLLLPDQTDSKPTSLQIMTEPFKEPGRNGRELGVALDRMSVSLARPFGQRTLDGRLVAVCLALAFGLHLLLLGTQRRTRRNTLIGAGVAALVLLWLRAQSITAFAAITGLLLGGTLLALTIKVLLLATRGEALRFNPRMKAHPALAAIAELAGWSIVTAAMTYPLITRLSSAFPDKLDSYLNSWILAWDHHQLRRAPLRLFDTNILYPYPQTLAQSEHLLGLYPLSGPLLLLGLAPPVVHNLVIFLAFVLCAFSMSLLVRDLTGSRIAAIAAGLIYAFYPYRVLQMAHVQQVSAQWMPFTFWALERFRRDGSWRYAIVVGIFFLLQSLVSYYHAIFLGVAVLIYGLFFLVADRRWREWRRLIKLGAVSTGIVLAHVPLALPYLYLQRRLGFQRSLEDATAFSAALADYLVPFGFNGFYRTSAALLDHFAPYATGLFTHGLGSWQVISGRLNQETLLFPGVLPLALAAVGVVLGRRRAIIWCMMLIIGVCLLLSLGSALRVTGGGPAVLDAMPFSLLPINRVIRVPARFVLAEILALAVLAGFGVAGLIHRLQRGHTRAIAPIATVLLLVLLGELIRAPVMLFPIVPANATVEEWLSQQPGARVLHLPAGNLEREARYEFYSAERFQLMLNGYSGYYDLPAFHGFMQHMQSQPDQRTMRMLQGLGVRYVVLHRDGLSEKHWNTLQRWLNRSTGVRSAAVLAGAEIYELAPDPWIEQIDAQIGDHGTVYVGSGGALPGAFAELLALRLHERVTAGKTRLGYRKLHRPAPNALPEYALFGPAEDPATVGYGDGAVIWQNDLFKLVKRPGT